jgi:hypothetical protein
MPPRQNAASLTERAEIISSLGKIYFCDYYIDLAAGPMLELDADENCARSSGSRRDASLELLADSCRISRKPEYVEEFLLNSPISPRFRNGWRPAEHLLEFFCRDSGWCRAVFIAVDRDEDGLRRIT